MVKCNLDKSNYKDKTLEIINEWNDLDGKTIR